MTLVVELPVCHECGHVGLVPINAASYKSFCNGPAGSLHPRRRMVRHVFADQGLVEDNPNGRDWQWPPRTKKGKR